jgi:hypothetical protein
VIRQTKCGFLICLWPGKQSKADTVKGKQQQREQGHAVDIHYQLDTQVWIILACIWNHARKLAMRVKYQGLRIEIFLSTKIDVVEHAVKATV